MKHLKLFLIPLLAISFSLHGQSIQCIVGLDTICCDQVHVEVSIMLSYDTIPVPCEAGIDLQIDPDVMNGILIDYNNVEIFVQERPTMNLPIQVIKTITPNYKNILSNIWYLSFEIPENDRIKYGINENNPVIGINTDRIIWIELKD